MKFPFASILTPCPVVRVPVDVASSVVFPESVPVVIAEVPAPKRGAPLESVVAPVPPYGTPTVLPFHAPFVTAPALLTENNFVLRAEFQPSNKSPGVVALFATMRAALFDIP
jgi:hypothetical protein